MFATVVYISSYTQNGQMDGYTNIYSFKRLPSIEIMNFETKISASFAIVTWGIVTELMIEIE